MECPQEINVTPEMIDAGLVEMSQHRYFSESAYSWAKAHCWLGQSGFASCKEIATMGRNTSSIFKSPSAQ